MDLFKGEERQAQDINVLDGKSTLNLRKQLLEQVRSETGPHSARDAGHIEVDANNKTLDKLKLKTLEPPGEQPYLLPPVGSASLDASSNYGDLRARKAKPLQGSFKHFYELQNQKLELQKQSLMKL